MPNELGVAEKCGGAVVVSVKEGKGLLLEDKEDGVDKFEVLGEVVQLRKLAAQKKEQRDAIRPRT
jgi:hypothetical protein